MAETRITAVEMHAKLGVAIDRAMIEPVIVTKHGRDHLVMLSAERYGTLLAASEAQTLATKPEPAPKLARMR